MTVSAAVVLTVVAANPAAAVVRHGNDRRNEIIGTEYRDRLYGHGRGDRLFGLGGPDDLYGQKGADSLYGGPGLDLLEGGAGADYLSDGDHFDTLRGGAGNDEFDLVSDGIYDSVNCGRGYDRVYYRDDDDVYVSGNCEVVVRR